MNLTEQNTLALLESGKINYIISTSAKGRMPARDSVKVRRKSVELGIPCLTSLDTANALAEIIVDSIRNKYYNGLRQVNLINSLIDCENYL